MSVPALRFCKSCGQDHPRTYFPSHNVMCKACKKKVDAARRGNRSTSKNDSASARERKRRYNRTHSDPVKQAARQAVKLAIGKGQLSPPATCEACCEVPRPRSDGARGLQAHHDDYSKPLDIRWLCTKCHRAWHKAHDAALAPPAAKDSIA